MPRNTDLSPRDRRRREAKQSAALSVLWLLLSGAVLLVLRALYCRGSLWGAVLLILALLDLGAIAPIWILLRERLKEIEGGEEDAASEY